MQTIVLKKSSSSHVLSHIYEHVYSIALDTLLRESGLMPIIDYDIYATTDAGVACIELESYTVDNIENYLEKVDTDGTIVREYAATAVAQVEVEKCVRFEIKDEQAFYNDLTDFHRTPWGQYRSDIGEWIHEEEGLEPVLYKISAPYPELKSELLPLYRLVMGSILNAIANDLADSYAGFIQSEAFAVNEFDELEMHISLHPDVDLSGIEAVANNSLAELLDSKSIERLLSELQDVSAMEFPPSNTFHYKDLKIEMNSDMWRQVATAYNLGSLKKEGHVIVEPVTR